MIKLRNFGHYFLFRSCSISKQGRDFRLFFSHKYVQNQNPSTQHLNPTRRDLKLSILAPHVLALETEEIKVKIFFGLGFMKAEVHFH